MKRDNDRQTAIILSIVGIVPVIWLALLIAPSISGGLPEIAANLATLFDLSLIHIFLSEQTIWINIVSQTVKGSLGVAPNTP